MAETKKPELLDQRLVRSLAHPLRVEILDLLTDQVLSPKQLASVMGRPLSHVSYHVRTLEENTTLELVKEEKRRGAVEHFFRATSDAFIGNPGWRRVPKLFLKAVSGASLQSFIDKSLKALKAGNLDADDATFTWMPIVLDAQGRQEVFKACEASIETLLSVQEKSKRRLAHSGSEASQYLIGVAGFEVAGSSGAA